MGWEDKVDNDCERVNHNKLIMFDDYLEYCKKNNFYVSYNNLLKQKFNKLEINWLGKNRNDEIKIVNENYYLKKIKDLEEQLKNSTQNFNVNDDGVHDKFKITKLTNEFLVENNYSYSKKCYLHKHYIRNVAIVNLWSTLRFLIDDDFNSADYRSIIRGLIIRYNLQIDADSFNGGYNRSKYYFPYYYYPLKVLEHYGFVKHKKDGTVIVLRSVNDVIDFMG